MKNVHKPCADEKSLKPEGNYQELLRKHIILLFCMTLKELDKNSRMFELCQNLLSAETARLKQ